MYFDKRNMEKGKGKMLKALHRIMNKELYPKCGIVID